MNIRSAIATFYRRYVVPRGLAGAVQVWERSGTTYVKVNACIPRPPFLKKARSAWRVTTANTYLTARAFADTGPRNRINRNRHKRRGRVLSCLTHEGEPLAAVA